MKYFRNLGIVAIFFFSFFYTEKIANLTLENNEIYKTIQTSSGDYEVSFVNAEINGENITPGLNGKTVDIKDSYFNMKDINTFNSYYLVYTTTYPEVTIENNKDKIITKGNANKRGVAFVLEYNEEMINYFKEQKIDFSVVVDLNTFQKNEVYEQLNNDEEKYKELETFINKYSTNSNICYLKPEIEDICRKEKKYLVKSDKILNNVTFKNIKNNIESGDIYYVNKNMDIKNMQLIINSILYKDLDIVRLSTLLSEERD